MIFSLALMNSLTRLSLIGLFATCGNCGVGSTLKTRILDWWLITAWSCFLCPGGLVEAGQPVYAFINLSFFAYSTYMYVQTFPEVNCVIETCGLTVLSGD